MDSLDMVDIVQETLEREGVLMSLRAQLRASVFKVVSKEKTQTQGTLIQEFLGTHDGTDLSFGKHVIF